MTEYYDLMKGFWLEMDHYEDIKMKCSDGAKTLQEFVEKDRVFDFLQDSNIELDQVQVQVLGKEKLMSLSEVFSRVRIEESRR